MRSIDAPDAQTEATDIPETILDQFGGPARPMTQAEVDAIAKRREGVRNSVCGA